jgi:hypothetical protein
MWKSMFREAQIIAILRHGIRRCVGGKDRAPAWYPLPSV